MNGILYPQPEGLLDPRNAMMMQTALGLLAGSGPSRTPTSFGQILGQAGMQGMNAYNQAQQMQLQEAFRQAQMKKMEEDMALRRQEMARRESAPISAGPGSMLFRPGENQPFFTVPFKPEPAPAPKPMTRKFRQGEDEVTQEYVDGEWREVGRGAAFRPATPAGAAPQPKPPTGFRYKADNSGELEAIPGGPKDTSGKDAAKAQGAIQKADIVIGKVNEALGQVGTTSTGGLGKVMGIMPGTKAYDLDKTLDTIKANLGFTELQAMRDASPTGGALGQVAIQELAMLQSTIASLDKGQSEANLRRGLEQVRTHFQNWKNAVLQAQQGQGPMPATPAAAPAQQRRVYDPATGTFK